MKRFTRLALAAGAIVSALAFSGSAWAAYAPSLTVTASRNAPGKPTAILLGHIQSAADDPTAKDTIYAPLGYGVNLSQPANTKIGDVSARLILRSGGNAEVDVEGQVIADNPANYAVQAQQCTGVATHAGGLEAEHHGRRHATDRSDLRRPGQLGPRPLSPRQRSSSALRARSARRQAPSFSSRSST